MKPETKLKLHSTVPFFLVVSLVWACWLVLTLYNQIAEVNKMNSTTLATDSVNSSAKTDASKSADPREAKWFNQSLEHFNSNSDTTWPQRYWTNTQYFNGSGPVFLLIGGEGEEHGDDVFSDNLTTQLAKEVGALLVVLEHRFYGQSRPTPDSSASNLRFLSIDHAVADLVNFRNFMHSNFNLSDGNKWVAIGCSYPGTLAALLRLRHSDRIHAALASSAPVKFELEFPSYYQMVNWAINSSNFECALALGDAMSTVNSLLESQEGRAELNSIFKNRFEELDKKKFSLVSWIAGAWSSAVQHNSDDWSTLNDLCDQMLNSSLGEPIETLANITLTYLNEKSNEMNFFRLNESDWEKVSDLSYRRNWVYQYCFEFGSFQTLSGWGWPLSVDLPLAFALDVCRALFETFSEETLVRNIQKFNRELGGDKYRGTRVVFVNGDRDPWSGAGLMNNSSVNPYSKVIVIEGASHCSDFRGHQEKNPPKINQAIAQIKQHIKDYLQE